MQPLPDRPGLARALARGVSELELSLDSEAADRMLDYVELLRYWNRSFNLTAVRDPAQMVSRHLLDSVALLPWVRGPALLDVGSGAGLPGLVLAMARPHLDVTLLDPALKRTRFLSHAVRTLALPRVRVVRARLQDYAPGFGFDTVTARASLALEVLLQAAPALLTPGGHLLAMQGRATQPIPPPPAGGRVQRVRLRVPGVAAERHLMVVQAGAGIDA